MSSFRGFSFIKIIPADRLCHDIILRRPQVLFSQGGVLYTAGFKVLLYLQNLLVGNKYQPY